jgi:hypothetical protein
MGTITVINTTPYKYQPVPEIGREYNAFDDGKISPNRHQVIKIVELIPFKECTDNKLVSDWTEDVTNCCWLYARETDYFVKATYENEILYFVRTEDGGWFSLGFWGSRLDIDGSLYDIMTKRINGDFGV